MAVSEADKPSDNNMLLLRRMWYSQSVSILSTYCSHEPYALRPRGNYGSYPFLYVNERLWGRIEIEFLIWIGYCCGFGCDNFLCRISYDAVFGILD